MRLVSATVAICVLAAATLQPASAQQTRITRIMGFAETSCGTWTAERKKRSPYLKELMELWALGFLSGSNWSRKDPDRLVGLDADAITSWLDNYCRRNPLETFPSAVIALAKELAQRAADKPPGAN